MPRLTRSPADHALDARLQAGVGLLRQGRPQEASAVFAAILSQAPNLAAAWHMMGMALHQMGRFGEAAARIERSLALDPANAAAHSNLGDALREAGDPERSLQSCDRALALDPLLVNAQVNRANALSALGRTEDALAAYDRVLARHPDRVVAIGNRAVTLQTLGRHQEALEGFARALALEPGRADLRFNASCSLLALGDYAQGLALFEWRWQGGRGLRPPDVGDTPPWRGAEPLAGKTLLLHAEQGFGDTLQFCRYAALAAGRGARVLLQVQPPLVRLMAGLAGPDLVLADGDPRPPFDLHCPLMSLPLAFGTTVATIPAGGAYLTAPAGEAAAWARRLGARTRPRIGLAWSGGRRPDQPHLSSVNARRNMPLAHLAALRGLEADFYSLQKGQPAEGELAALDPQAWGGPPIIDLAGSLSDFADTAAVIENLDLVITVDTALAHLAGAMGKPVWILNRFDACWRWLTDRQDSPWHPTARLIRQSRPGDWAGVMDQTRQALAAWIAEDARR